MYASSRGGVAKRLRFVQAHDADLLVDVEHAGEELLAVAQGHLYGYASFLSKPQVVDESRHRTSVTTADIAPTGSLGSM